MLGGQAPLSLDHLDLISYAKEEVTRANLHLVTGRSVLTGHDVHRHEANDIYIGQPGDSLETRVDIAQEERVAKGPALAVISAFNGVHETSQGGVGLRDDPRLGRTRLQRDASNHRHAKVLGRLDMDDRSQRAAGINEVSDLLEHLLIDQCSA